MKMILQEINNCIGGQLHGNNVSVNGVGIDTRSLVSGNLYVAIKGENFDGNDFVEIALKAGAKAAIVQRQIDTQLPHIIVDDTRQALTALATTWRQKCNAKIIAVTGSNGKTTVKEMIAAILKTDQAVLSTLGNLNNEIGVPLTLLKLESEHAFGVIEMGANHHGEIANLGRCAQPDIGVITNVGSAHIEGFGSIEGIAKAKGEMYQALNKHGVAVINADDHFYEYWQSLIKDRKQISFGLDKPADVTAEIKELIIVDGQFKTDFTLKYQDQKVPVQLALAGRHNVLNALAATAAALAADISLSNIKKGLENVCAVSGRMQALQGNHGGLVINDSYNANPTSLKAALDVLMTVEGEHWVVLGAFGELGADSENIHKEMGELMRSMNVVRLAAIGPNTESTVLAFGKGAKFFANHDALIDFLKQQLTGPEVVLVKGSRAQRMERVTKALTEPEVV